MTLAPMLEKSLTHPEPNSSFRDRLAMNWDSHLVSGNPSLFMDISSKRSH